MDYYVYVWENLDNNEVFYVGFGKHNRYKSTNKRNKNFLKYIENNTNVLPKVVIDNLSEDEAREKEKELIDYYWSIGQATTNLRQGGCGGNTVKLLSEDKLKDFKHKISIDSKRKWQNQEIRNHIINAVRESMTQDSVREKISQLTKEGMKKPDNWKRFIKNRANTVIIETPKDKYTFESLTKAITFLWDNYRIKGYFLRNKIRPTNVKRHINENI